MRSDTNPEVSAPQSGSGGPNTSPTPMQHFIAVTPLGKNRPCPPMKPLVFMKAGEKLSPIAVTKPKSGFKPGPGCTASKFHPILSDVGKINIQLQSQHPFYDVDNAAPLKVNVGSVLNKPDHLQHSAQKCKRTTHRGDDGPTGAANNSTSCPIVT